MSQEWTDGRDPTNTPPAVRPVEVVAKRVREVRRHRGLSAAQLAERLQAVGLKWDRSIVANLENGRRASVGVDELLALAHVLHVAPIHLLFPIDDGDQAYYFTPRTTIRAKVAREWARGRHALTDRRFYWSEVPEAEWAPPPQGRTLTKAEREEYLATFDEDDGGASGIDREAHP